MWRDGNNLRKYFSKGWAVTIGSADPSTSNEKYKTNCKIKFDAWKASNRASDRSCRSEIVW